MVSLGLLNLLLNLGTLQSITAQNACLQHTLSFLPNFLQVRELSPRPYISKLLLFSRNIHYHAHPLTARIGPAILSEGFVFSSVPPSTCRDSTLKFRLRPLSSTSYIIHHSLITRSFDTISELQKSHLSINYKQTPVSDNKQWLFISMGQTISLNCGSKRSYCSSPDDIE